VCSLAVVDVNRRYGKCVRYSLSGVSIQRDARKVQNVKNVRNVTKLPQYLIGQSQPPATTAYAAGTLPSCGRHAIKYEIIEIKFVLHHKLHNK